MADAVIQGNQNTTKLINQLKSSAKQYPILNKNEEHALIRKFKKNREELNRLLFMHNVRTVFSMAKTYMSKTKDFDSLVQNGMLGLMEAARRFDTGKNIKFCTYATIWVKKYMTMNYYTSQYKVDSNTVSLNAPAFGGGQPDQDVSGDETFENTLMRYADASLSPNVKDIDSQLAGNEQSAICDKLYRAMMQDSSLSSTDKAVFTDIFVEQEKTRDIAEKYHMDPLKVSEIKHRILSKLKTVLAEQYNINQYSDIG